jgi:hypothetical protein
MTQAKTIPDSPEYLRERNGPGNQVCRHVGPPRVLAATVSAGYWMQVIIRAGALLSFLLNSNLEVKVSCALVPSNVSGANSPTPRDDIIEAVDWMSAEKPTSRYQSGQLPRSPFLDNFRVADHPPRTSIIFASTSLVRSVLAQERPNGILAELGLKSTTALTSSRSFKPAAAVLEALETICVGSRFSFPHLRDTGFSG